MASAIMAKEKEAMESRGFLKLINFMKRVESDGIPANGEEVAISPQKDGLVGCGDLSSQQKISRLGGACKVKHHFCTYCATESGDHDLLSYVTGSLVCEMCVRNGRNKCTHVMVDDNEELHRKGMHLITLLLDDYRLTSDSPDAKVHDMLPEGPVECFSGYTDKGVKVMENLNLRELVSQDGQHYHRRHLFDYSRHILHTEETVDVLAESTVKFDPNAKEKESTTTNIDYVLGSNAARDDTFIMNVTMDLLLRGNNMEELPSDRPSLVARLKLRLL